MSTPRSHESAILRPRHRDPDFFYKHNRTFECCVCHWFILFPTSARDATALRRTARIHFTRHMLTKHGAFAHPYRVKRGSGVFGPPTRRTAADIARLNG